MALQPDAVQVTTWLSRLHLLYGVPFNYLVPDIRMLPDESIRFFQVDENWIAALIDGAYSLGTTQTTSGVSQALRPQVSEYVNRNLSVVRSLMLDEESTPSSTPIRMSGFFLRSGAVAGWPGTEVTGYSDAAGTTELNILRLERISPSLLFCLFDGAIARVDMQQPAEALHFAFDPPRENINTDDLVKTKRYVNSYGGVQAGTYATGVLYQVNISAKRVVGIQALAGSIAANGWAPGTPQEDMVLTSAEFGLAMVQNTESVSFIIDNPHNV